MKILIVSHNPITTYNNMGKTLQSLFSAFKSHELCHFYIYPTIPDVDFCNSYFRITDKDVLKSYFKFKSPGREIFKKEINTQEHILFENSGDVHIYKNPKNKRPLRMLLRDLIWKCSSWYSNKLRQWIENEAPTAIFVAPGTAKFLYDIALKFSKKHNLPIITYICDDFYFTKPSKSPLKLMQERLLKKKIEKLVLRSSHIIGICDEVCDSYSKHFGSSTSVIMTGTAFAISKQANVYNKVTTITYTGNISCNRYVSIAEIGQALDLINEQDETDFSIDVYSAETNKEILSVFEPIKSIKFRGFVTGKEYEEVFNLSQILLHTEAFDEESVDLVKHSVSTKIADILGSGKCLFAYGPEQVSSMKHLIRNNCAITATKREELVMVLRKLFSDSELREKTAKNALTVAEKYHNSNNNSNYLRSICTKL